MFQAGAGQLGGPCRWRLNQQATLNKQCYMDSVGSNLNKDWGTYLNPRPRPFGLV